MEDLMALLMAIIYTVNVRHIKEKKQGLAGKQLEDAHRKDQAEIREAVLRLVAENTEEQEAEA